MTFSDILSNIDSLTLDEKQAVLAAVSQAIDHDTKTLKENSVVSKHLDTMKGFAGEDYLEGRRRENTYARVVVSVCLKEAGYNISAIGKILGKDHSTIIHYMNMWKNAMSLPIVFRDLISLYNKYKAAL